jgi:hypothetical protein
MGPRTGLDACDEFFKCWQSGRIQTPITGRILVLNAVASVAEARAYRRVRKDFLLHLPPLSRNSTRDLALS